MDTEKLGTSSILNYLSRFPAMIWDSRLRHRLQNPKNILAGADLKEGQTVLEVGCGSGFFTIPAAKLIGDSGHLIAMDPMAYFVDEVRQQVRAHGLANVEVIRRDALRTGLETASVDVVLLLGVVPFATLPLSQLLPEMHRVLRSAGTLALWQFPAAAGVPTAIERSGLFSYSRKHHSTRTFVRNDLPQQGASFDAARIANIDRMDISGHIRLRSATKLDVEFARLVHHRALREVVVRQFGPWDEELQNGFFEQSGFPDGFEIIEYDGTPCGYLRTKESSTESEVHNLYIDPDFQRRGIGTLLLERAIARGKPVGLQVLFENTEAARLYTRLGFAVIGETDTHFKMRLHQKEDV